MFGCEIIVINTCLNVYATSALNYTGLSMVMR